MVFVRGMLAQAILDQVTYFVTVVDLIFCLLIQHSSHVISASRWLFSIRSRRSLCGSSGKQLPERFLGRYYLKSLVFAATSVDSAFAASVQVPLRSFLHARLIRELSTTTLTLI